MAAIVPSTGGGFTTATDSSEIDFTISGRDITASLVNGSIGATRLSAGVNTSLGLANTALQPSTIGVTVQGYSATLAGITTQKITNWDTTYGWGNHASAGYLLSSTAASTYQPLDADLTAIAALAGTSGLLRKTAADTWSLDAATYLQSGAIGSTVLAYDANLQAFVTAFTLPTADGTSGQVLTTNGAGTLSLTAIPYSLIIACTGTTQPLTVETAKETLRADRAFTLTGVRASLTTAATGSTVVVDINLNGVSVLGTKLSIDASELTSVTADSAATIVTSAIPSDGQITIDIDQVGATTPGTGLKVALLGTLV